MIATVQLVIEAVFLVVGRQNADVANTMHLRDVAMATTFWLLMCHDFCCGTIFDSRGGFWGSSYPMKSWPISRF